MAVGSLLSQMDSPVQLTVYKSVNTRLGLLINLDDHSISDFHCRKQRYNSR